MRLRRAFPSGKLASDNVSAHCNGTPTKKVRRGASIGYLPSRLLRYVQNPLASTKALIFYWSRMDPSRDINCCIENALFLLSGERESSRLGSSDALELHSV